jgi:hypothetical protein
LIDKDFQNLEKAAANLTKAELLGEVYGSKQIGEGSVDIFDRGLAIQYQGRRLYAIELDAATMATAKANFDYILDN